MNIERLRMVRDEIKNKKLFPEVTFEMESWLCSVHQDVEDWNQENHCGTAACIAGYAWIIMNSLRSLEEREEWDAFSERQASGWLELSNDEEELLFLRYAGNNDLAIELLDYIVDNNIEHLSHDEFVTWANDA